MNSVSLFFFVFNNLFSVVIFCAAIAFSLKGVAAAIQFEAEGRDFEKAVVRLLMAIACGVILILTK